MAVEVDPQNTEHVIELQVGLIAIDKQSKALLVEQTTQPESLVQGGSFRAGLSGAGLLHVRIAWQVIHFFRVP